VKAANILLVCVSKVCAPRRKDGEGNVEIILSKFKFTSTQWNLGGRKDGGRREGRNRKRRRDGKFGRLVEAELHDSWV
jgi:hypothetical protein